MRRTIVVLFLFVSLTQAAIGADILTRKAFDLVLAVDNQSRFETKISESPYILDNNTIQIYPGEHIFVELEIQKNTITKFTIVDEIRRPEKTIDIDFQQEREGNTHKSMTLAIKNPLNVKIKYMAMLYMLEQKKWISTPMPPIRAHKSSFERWPNIVLTVALYNWTLN